MASPIRRIQGGFLGAMLVVFNVSLYDAQDNCGYLALGNQTRRVPRDGTLRTGDQDGWAAKVGSRPYRDVAV